MAGTAYILDLCSEDHQHSNIVAEKLITLSIREQDTIVSISDNALASDTLDPLLAKHCRNILYLENENKIEAFYNTKLHLDKKEITVIFVLCSKKEIQFWDLMLKTFLTNIYEWTIVPVDTIDPDASSADDILQKISAFLMSLPGAGDVTILTSPIIPNDAFVHGFSCRTGGLSSVPGMKSLNLVCSNTKRDAKALVDDNRRRLSVAMGFDPAHFHVAIAVHGNCVHVVGEKQTEGYDGIVTDRRGTTLGAPGADCVTMVFADPVKRACAALHSGWMGTVKRACVEVLHKMTSTFGSDPSDIRVAMGPSIGPCCFEFDADQTGQFTDIAAESVVWKAGHNKAFINLQLCNRVLLEQHGVSPDRIDDQSCTKCTTCNPELFFSYRRDDRPFGNQLGVIGIR